MNHGVISATFLCLDVSSLRRYLCSWVEDLLGVLLKSSSHPGKSGDSCADPLFVATQDLSSTQLYVC